MHRMRLMPHMRRTFRPDNQRMTDEITVEFDTALQSLDALQAAVYRLVGHATCQINQVDGRYFCRLTPSRSKSGKENTDTSELKEHFSYLVADENLRERIAIKTDPLRNLILSLAFGSLAAQQSDKPRT